MLRTVVLAALLVAGASASMRTVYNNHPLPRGLLGTRDTGKPLFLTPFIKDNQAALAKQLSLVGYLDGDNVPSYSGYFTVNETTESNMFFWFFPSLDKNPDAPTLLWLQGGPGGSSLFGLFVEHGPYAVGADQKTYLRNTTWAKNFNMLYIDNPVGTGFSFTKHDAGYVTNQEEVGRDLFEALQQFCTVFDDKCGNFYITGESYAGKYVPAAAYTIHKHKAEAKMNLKGIAIGDGLCDPATMFDYADFLLSVGLIDDVQAKHFRAEQDKAKKLIENSEYYKAFLVFDELLNGDKLPNGTKPYFKQITGLDFYYNFLITNEPKSFGYYNSFVQNTQTRQAIHVGNLTYNDGSMVETKLEMDIMKSVKPWIAELMDNYKVMIYNGQLDIIIAYPLTTSFVNSIQWGGSNELSKTDRIIWRNPKTKEPAGYVRRVKNFTEVMVRNAGHILPYDQPDNAFDMIDRFINDKDFN